MKLNIHLSQREDNHIKQFKVILIDGNIVFDENNKIPFCHGAYIQFSADYSPVYCEFSKGKVNTRFTYEIGKNTNHYLYAKLNFIQRQKLKYITRQSWFHLHPVPTWGLIINFVVLVANLTFAVLNFQNSHRLTESSYLELLKRQTLLQEERAKEIQGLRTELNTLKDSLQRMNIQTADTTKK